MKVALFTIGMIPVKEPKDFILKVTETNKWIYQGHKIQDQYTKAVGFLCTNSEQLELKTKFPLK